jgi:hypothetical protein
MQGSKKNGLVKSQIHPPRYLLPARDDGISLYPQSVTAHV